jgi:hypothetical protein
MASSSLSRNNVGTVEQTETRTIMLDVFITLQDEPDHSAEYVLRVNGRTVKRMNGFTARRMNLFNDQKGSY